MSKVGPRSYKVLNTEGNCVVRNSKHINKSTNKLKIKTDNFLDDYDVKCDRNEQKLQFENNVTSDSVPNISSNYYTTRSGRQIRKPQRFKDFV